MSRHSVATAAVMVALLIGVLLALSLLVPGVRREAEGLVGPLSLGGLRVVGLFLAGIAAPIVYVFKRLGRALPSSEREQQLRADNEEVRRVLARLESDVTARDEARRRELDEARQRIATLEASVAAKKAEIHEVDRQIAQLESEAPREVTPAEVRAFWKSAPGYIE